MQYKGASFDNLVWEIYMKSLYKCFVHFLVASLIFVPFSLNAAMVSTDKVAITQQNLNFQQQNQVNRDKVASFLARADVVAKLETMGIDSKMAKERVDALTQDEVNRLAANIDELPAGGTVTTWGWVGIVAGIAILVWLIFYNK